MARHMDRTERLQTVGEEVFNAVSHGIGTGLGILGLVLLILRARPLGDTLTLVSVVIFGCTLILLYLMSTLYHAIAHKGAKRVLRVFDHVMIFLLIAGTYTPFTLISMRGTLGTVLLIVIWAVAIVNVVLSAISLTRFKTLGMVSYVVMGWAIVVAMPTLIRGVGWGGAGMLLAGGIFYTAGIFFYARKTRYFSHAIWHIFVLLGSICHFFAVYSFVL